MTDKEFIDLLTSKFIGYKIKPINELNTMNYTMTKDHCVSDT